MNQHTHYVWHNQFTLDICYVRFEVSMVVSMKTTVFRDVTPQSTNI